MGSLVHDTIMFEVLFYLYSFMCKNLMKSLFYKIFLCHSALNKMDGSGENVMQRRRVGTWLPAFYFLQEEDRKKREELEAIMAENNQKMEEAQRKLVIMSFYFVCCLVV